MLLQLFKFTVDGVIDEFKPNVVLLFPSLHIVIVPVVPKNNYELFAHVLLDNAYSQAYEPDILIFKNPVPQIPPAIGFHI